MVIKVNKIKQGPKMTKFRAFVALRCNSILELSQKSGIGRTLLYYYFAHPSSLGLEQIKSLAPLLGCTPHDLAKKIMDGEFRE